MVFGLVDRENYDLRIFYVDNNRQKEKLLKKCLYFSNSIINNQDINEENLSARIYSNSFSTYQTKDINKLRFKVT